VPEVRSWHYQNFIEANRSAPCLKPLSASSLHRHLIIGLLSSTTTAPPHENANLTAPAPNFNGTGAPLEKDFSNNGNSFSSNRWLSSPVFAAPDNAALGNPYHLGAHHDSDDAPKRIRIVGSTSVSPELFEKIYLSQNRVHGDLRKAFGNPTLL